MNGSVLQSHLKHYYANSLLKELDAESLQMIPQFKNKNSNQKKNMKTFLADSQNPIQETTQNHKENQLDFLEAKIKASSKEIIKNFKALNVKEENEEIIETISIRSFIFDQNDLDISSIKESKVLSYQGDEYQAIYSSVFQNYKSQYKVQNAQENTLQEQNKFNTEFTFNNLQFSSKMIFFNENQETTKEVTVEQQNPPLVESLLHNSCLNSKDFQANRKSYQNNPFEKKTKKALEKMRHKMANKIIQAWRNYKSPLNSLEFFAQFFKHFFDGNLNRKYTQSNQLKFQWFLKNYMNIGNQDFEMFYNKLIKGLDF